MIFHSTACLMFISHGTFVMITNIGAERTDSQVAVMSHKGSKPYFQALDPLAPGTHSIRTSLSHNTVIHALLMLQAVHLFRVSAGHLIGVRPLSSLPSTTSSTWSSGQVWSGPLNEPNVCRINYSSLFSLLRRWFPQLFAGIPHSPPGILLRTKC